MRGVPLGTAGTSRRMASPSELSRYLRTSEEPGMRRRRWIVGLSLVGAAMGKIVTAYQTGIVSHLPDPPGPFDADKVDASDYAFRRAQSPDGPMMIVTYALTAWLAAAGGADRSRALPVLLAAKTLGDLGVDVQLAREEWRENGAFCAYCQLATVLSAVSVALALPDAVRALRRS